jgi:tetratricopeptide (TPR) repeat protein
MSEILTFDLPYKVKMIERKNNYNTMLNFSIILLTKNDEQKLTTLLNSLIEFRDRGGEVCILDIGSTDNTINIAKEWGCIVEDGSSFSRVIDDDMALILNEKFSKDDIDIDDHPNNFHLKNGDTYFDYSGARNYAATLSSNDIIFMISTDANLTFFNISEIENIINDGHDGILFTYYHNKKNNVWKIYNRKKFTWCNVLYEVLNITDENIKIITVAEDCLRLDSNEEVENIDYNLAGLAVNCFLDMGNDNLSYIFARTLLKNNFLGSAYNEFQRHLTICNNNVKRSESLVMIGDYLIKIGRDEEGINHYQRAYLECDTIRLPLYRLGKHYYFTGDRNKCIFYLEGCLNIPKTENSSDIDDDNFFMYNDGPYSMLYVSYWWNDDRKKGKYYFDKAIALNPYFKLYIDESIYHYEYKISDIRGYLTFQDVQYLYSESKKVKTILEVYPENGRGTHALLAGCDGLITVITKNDEKEFSNVLENPGNLRIINMSSGNAIELLEFENEKFDMVILHNYHEIINDYNPHLGISTFEKFSKKLICGSNYNENKNLIDGTFEITGKKDNIWYKNIESFEKTTIYIKKTI